MKIGIIIHSHTGNTLSIGERLRETFLAAGHSVFLEQVIAENEDPNGNVKVTLKTIPDIMVYDYVILGAPVRAFALSPIMKTYLSQLSEAKGKNFACFVTQHFPKPWMGGNHAIKQMTEAIRQKEGKVKDTGIVNWTSKSREVQIKDILDRFGSI